MSKRLTSKVAHSLSEFCEQSPMDRICEMACIFPYIKNEDLVVNTIVIDNGQLEKAISIFFVSIIDGL